MKRIFLMIMLGALTAGLSVITVISLINQEIYGRFGSVVRLEEAPGRYWAGLLLLVGMIGLLVSWMWKTRHA